MKKTLSIFALLMTLACTCANAQDERKIIQAIDNSEYTHYYYYNEENVLVWELFGTTRDEYVYGSSKLPVQKRQYSWIAASKEYKLINTEDYTYDADGNMTEKIQVKNVGSAFEVTWKYVYSNYNNGVATYYDEYKNGSLYYMYKQVPTFNSQNLLTSCIVYYADPDDYTNPTYETVEYKDEDYKYSKTYDANGYLTEEVNGKNSYSYTYTSINPNYAPKNLKASMNNGTVVLTWDAVTGAEKYIVSYDQERIEVNNTEFSAVVGTGERKFTVQAVIDGVERNAATPISAEVVDAGKLAITDLAAGTIFETIEETESEEVKTRTFYNIPLTWTLPEGHSEILKFNIYYNSKAYGDNCVVSQTDPNATSYLLKVDPFEVAEWSEEGDLTNGIDIPIYIKVVYVTGESENSNIVVVNPYNAINKGEVSIDTVVKDSTETIMYNTAGMRTSKANGIVIKNGKKYLMK